MGYDAFVCCNCWREGKTTKPPVPLDDLYIDSDGWLTAHSLDGAQDWDRYYELEDWKDSGCEHEGMGYDFHLGNISGMAMLCSYIEGLGEGLASNFIAMLPKSNAGSFPSEKAQAVLDEIPAIRQAARSLHEYSLFVRGKENWSGCSLNQNWEITPCSSFGEPAQAEFTLMRNGVEFRARRFRQRVIKGSSRRDKDRAVLIALDYETGREVGDEFEVDWPIDPFYVHDTEFEVRERDDVVEFLEWKLSIFEELLKVSVETGNPIAWC